MMHARSLALLAAVLVTTIGCAGLTSPMAQPTADLRGVSLASVSLTGAVVRADFDVTNPNSFSIPIRAVDWELSIGNAQPFRGTAQVNTSIPAYGSTPMAVDLELSAMTAITTIQAIRSGARDYHLGGVIHFASPVGEISLSFEEQGTIDDAALSRL